MNFHRGVASLRPNPGREVSEESARERTRTPRLGFVSADHLPIGCLTFPELPLVTSRPCSVAAFMNSGNYATPAEDCDVEFPRKLYIISNIEAKSLSRFFGVNFTVAYSITLNNKCQSIFGVLLIEHLPFSVRN